MITIDEAANMYNSIDAFIQRIDAIKSDIDNELEEFACLENYLVLACKDYCADENIPIDKRWNVFKKAPKKEHLLFSRFPDFKDIGLTTERLSTWPLQRLDVFYVVACLDDWTEAFHKKEKTDWVKGLNEGEIDVWKNYYMKWYIGSWRYNW